jgi:hypothetical protein
MSTFCGSMLRLEKDSALDASNVISYSRGYLTFGNIRLKSTPTHNLQMTKVVPPSSNDAIKHLKVARSDSVAIPLSL